MSLSWTRGTLEPPDGMDVDAESCRNESIGVFESGNNVGTITPKHRAKRTSRADQEAGRINNIDVPALSAKPPSPVQIRTAPPPFTCANWTIPRLVGGASRSQVFSNVLEFGSWSATPTAQTTQFITRALIASCVAGNHENLHLERPGREISIRPREDGSCNLQLSVKLARDRGRA